MSVVILQGERRGSSGLWVGALSVCIAALAGQTVARAQTVAGAETAAQSADHGQDAPLVAPVPVPAVRPPSARAQRAAITPAATKSPATVHIARAAPSATPPAATRLSASYAIKFDGVDIGTAQFRASLGPQGYSLDSQAEISAMFGAFTWKESSHTQGVLDGEAGNSTEVSSAQDSSTQASQAQIRPATYRVDFADNGEKGYIHLGYTGATVTQLQRAPKPQDSAERVPLRDAHMKNVLDPLSAAVALTHGTRNPCNRRLAIFDGRERFDLVVTLKRESRVNASSGAGQLGHAYVCRIRRISIAGHRPEQVEADASPDRVTEIVLRSVPGANLFVPQSMSIGTRWGQATLTARRIEITSPGSGQIALSQ